jgi:rhomboid protease GluP
MAEGDPWYIRLLDQLGVNTTKLRWRLYQRRRQAERIMEEGVGPSKIIPWWSYANKICPHCRAVNNRDASTCNSCGKRLPSMLGYRVRRLLVGSVPKDSAIVSMGFLGLIFLFFSVQVVLDGRGMRGLMAPSSNALGMLGMFSRQWVIDHSEWWRILAFGLVHGGLIHFGFNAYSLVQIGPMVEAQLSPAKMIVLVTFSQLTAAAACWVMYGPYESIVGASGWIFGLVGFGILYAHRAGPSLHHIRDSLLRWAIFLFLLGFVVNMYGGGPGIGNAAHAGGMAGGLLFALIPVGRVRVERSLEKVWSVAGMICVVLWMVTLVLVIRQVIVVWPQVQGQ